MKIIANTKDGVLLEATNEEIANLFGTYYHSNNFSKENLKLGTEIKVSEIYRKYNLINSYLDRSEYDGARAKLKEMLDALTPIENLIIKATGK